MTLELIGAAGAFAHGDQMKTGAKISGRSPYGKTFDNGTGLAQFLMFGIAGWALTQVNRGFPTLGMG